MILRDPEKAKYELELRDKIAIEVFLSFLHRNETFDQKASDAYRAADAMLNKRNQTNASTKL